MSFFNNHKTLFGAALGLFLFLTTYIAIIPALENQKINQPLPRQSKELSADEQAGKMVYIENGCVACHTQQVRNVEMDNVFGKRPSIPADYAIKSLEKYSQFNGNRTHRTRFNKCGRKTT